MKHYSLNYGCRYWMTLLVAACVSASAVFAQEAGEREENQTDIRIVEGADELPARLQKAVSRYLKDNPLPEGYKLQVEVGRYFDQGNLNSSEEYEPYVKSVVPIDPDGAEQGVMHVFERIRQKLAEKIPYEDGERHGTAKRFSDGKVRAEIPWKNGVIEGVKKEFYPDGEVLSEVEMDDSKANGTTKTYSPEGELMREGQMKEGDRHGQMIDYWPETGEPRRKVVYDKGKIVDDVTMYHENGNVQRVIPIEDNVRQGVGKVCDEQGEETEKTYWVDGRRVSKFEYEQFVRNREQKEE